MHLVPANPHFILTVRVGNCLSINTHGGYEHRRWGLHLCSTVTVL